MLKSIGFSYLDSGVKITSKEPLIDDAVVPAMPGPGKTRQCLTGSSSACQGQAGQGRPGRALRGMTE